MSLHNQSTLAEQMVIRALGLLPSLEAAGIVMASAVWEQEDVCFNFPNLDNGNRADCQSMSRVPGE
jgi:hypothetical protein